METIKLTALRDFAVDHLPRAQQTRSQKHQSQDGYHYALYGIATLAQSSATAPAVEQAAARLLHLTMNLSINWEPENQPSARQRHDLSYQAIAAATDLCTLTGTSLSWLADAMKQEAPPPAPPPDPSAQPSSTLPSLTPGISLSTKQAAEYLKVKEQTLHKWASEQSGPLQPTRSNRRLYWQSDDIIRITKGT
jgi:hypothetical protein